MRRKESRGEGARASRRRFTKAVAAAVVAAAPIGASAQKSSAPKQEKKEQPKQEPKAPPNPPQQQQEQKPSPVAEAYAEVAKERFGKYLDEDEFKRVKRDIESYVRTSERLRSVKLENWDEPDFIFQA